MIGSLLVALVPLFALSLAVGVVHRATLFDAAPTWSDEIYHWHQAGTFARAGLDGGYYTIGEALPPAEYSRFYAWGMYGPIFYGTIGKITGWGLTTYLAINHLLLAAALFAFAWTSRLDRARLAWMAATLVTFVPIYVFLPASMQLGLHLAIGVASAAFFRPLILRPRVLPWPVLLAAVALIAGAALIRPTWGLLFVPLFFLGTGRLTRVRAGALFLLAVVLTLALAALFQSSAAPYGLLRDEVQQQITSSPLDAVAAIARGALVNLRDLARYESYVFGQRFQILGLGLLWVATRFFRRLRPGGDAAVDSTERLFHEYNLLAVFAISVTFHDYHSEDVRVLAPHYLASLLLMIRFDRRWFLAACVASMFLLMPEAYRDFRQYTNFNGEVRRHQDAWHEQLAALAYDPDAESPWCNTLSHSYSFFEDERIGASILVAVEPGIGLSWFEDANRPGQFKARYLMLTDDERQRLGRRLDVEPLARLARGALYLNRDAPCPRGIESGGF
ncbi:MAG: hypothetical protein GY716_22445 [bacterium]|nr:hypothetical protein [bacterium]